MMLEDKKFYLVDTDGSVYHISTKGAPNDGKVIMRHSKRGNWTSQCKGKVALRLRDSGNGIAVEIMNSQDGSISCKSLDYLDAWELYHALKVYFKVGGLKQGVLLPIPSKETE